MKVGLPQAQVLFQELGVKTANKWSAARMGEKIPTLAAVISEGNKEATTDESAAVLKALLAAIESEDEIEVVDEDQTFGAKKSKKAAKEEKPAKAEKKSSKKAAKVEEEDEDEEEEEEEEAEESDDEDEDEEEEEEEEAEEKPKKSSKKSDKAKPAKAEKTEKAKAEKKEAVEKKPGVIARIAEMITEATEEKPISKAKMLARLVKFFPDREEEAMQKTINAQVPGRLRKEKDMDIDKNDKGYFLAPAKKKSKK